MGFKHKQLFKIFNNEDNGEQPFIKPKLPKGDAAEQRIMQLEHIHLSDSLLLEQQDKEIGSLKKQLSAAHKNYNDLLNTEGVHTKLYDAENEIDSLKRHIKWIKDAVLEFAEQLEEV